MAKYFFLLHARQHGVDAEAIAVKGDHASDLQESIRLAAEFFHSKN
jgi:hypothetical protein